MRKKYDDDMVKAYMTCSNLATEQYQRGLKDKKYDGDIRVLPSYKKLPKGYEMVKALTSRQVDISVRGAAAKAIGKRLDPEKGFMAESFGDLEKEIKKYKLVSVGDVYAGFVLKGSKENGGHIVCFRGTASAQEWILNLLVVQVPLPLFWADKAAGPLKSTILNSVKKVKVSMGFLIQYALVASQVYETIDKLDEEEGKSTLPITVTGYSLGGALATLGALAVRLANRLISGKVMLYNIAAPRVGNESFAKLFQLLVPTAYRVVNMGDLVPMVPPTKAEIGKFKVQYTHVGTEASFLWQEGDVERNHLNYDLPIEKKIPTITPKMPKGPVNGRPSHTAKQIKESTSPGVKKVKRKETKEVVNIGEKLVDKAVDKAVDNLKDKIKTNLSEDLMEKKSALRKFLGF